MHEIFVHLLILSYTVTSRENVYHISNFLGEPKTLNLAHNLYQPMMLLEKEANYSILNLRFSAFGKLFEIF